ncbi:hypothetical protein ACFLX0_01560 [Chloroflexota bacterium]
MSRLWRQIIKDEKGQALPAVLILMVLGGLLIAPSLRYASTSLIAGRAIESNVRGVLAADAGVEHVLWAIGNSEELPLQLPDINDLEVTMVTEQIGNKPYALYFGGFEATGDDSDYLDVSGEIAGDEYTITVTRQPEADGNVKLSEIGVRLPIGYVYQDGSASEDNFPGNLSFNNPVDTLDGAGAHMLVWELPSLPKVLEGDPADQSFYIIGEGVHEADYAWVVTTRDNVLTVGEIIGELYTIEATAKVPGSGGEDIAKVEAYVLKEEGEGVMHIISWQINPQEN